MKRNSWKNQASTNNLLERNKLIGDEDFKGGLNFQARKTPEEEKEEDKKKKEAEELSRLKPKFDKKTGEAVWTF